MGWLCDVHIRVCAGAIDSRAPIGSKRWHIFPSLPT